MIAQYIRTDFTGGMSHPLPYVDDTIQIYIGGQNAEQDLYKKYKETSADIHHFTHPTMRFMGKYAPDSILTIHDCVSERFYNVSLHHQYKLFESICTISHFSKQEISTTYSISPDKIHIVPNYFSPLLKPTKKRTDQIDLLYIGSTMKHKNLEFLPKILDILRHQIDLPVTLTRVGYTSRYPLPPQFRNIENMEDIQSAFDGATHYLAPSLYEGFNIPLIEAIATSTPIIYSGIPVHSEVIGRTGCSFDVEQWINKILHPDPLPPCKFTLTNAQKELLNLYDALKKS